MGERLGALVGLAALLSVSCNREVDMPSVREELTAGMPAPDFSAATSEGTELTLRSFRGKLVVLYFYPKDDTPGCTREACSFRDAQAELRERGVIVLGVSRDSQQSHQSFEQKHSLNFPLLSDPQGLIVAAYQAWKQPPAGVTPPQGINRSTFLIDPQGVIRRIWRGVKVEGHIDEVLAAVKELHGS
jgi:thioredoxin-dependent peroxiredoxin